jgi:hypothetical protein
MTPAERQYQVYAEGRHSPAKGGGDQESEPLGRAFDIGEIERSLQSGGADASSKIADGGTQAGQNAAQTFTSGVAGAGGRSARAPRPPSSPASAAFSLPLD